MEAGFEVLLLKRDEAENGLNSQALARRFRALEAEDLRTRGALLILRKPGTA
jgi:hypothetical protein